MKQKYINFICALGGISAIIGAAITSDNMNELTKSEPLPFALYVVGLFIFGLSVGLDINNKKEN